MNESASEALNRKDPALSAPTPVRLGQAERFDASTDVVIVGFGGAGVTAALEARANGAAVIALDRLEGGGATAISGGIVYAGGGTSIQKQAKVEDDVEAMFQYLKLETQGIVSEETLRDFCEQSASNLEWLSSHGVPFEASLCPYKTSYPTDDYYLYYSGNESFAPYTDVAKPAPRGHRAKGKGLPGENFYKPLRESALRAGVELRELSRVTALVVDSSENVIGVEVHSVEDKLQGALMRRIYRLAMALRNYAPNVSRSLYARLGEMEERHGVRRLIEAKRGVILSAGGFIYNRAMVEHYAPAYRPGMPLGTIGDDGLGIRLGESVDGLADNMSRVSAWRFINPPEAFTRGILVNKKGERYVNEMLYGAAVGEAMVERNGGKAILIIDEPMRKLAREQCKPGRAQWFQRGPALLNLWFNRKEARTLGELAALINVPREALEASVAAYNAGVESGKDAFGKPASQLQKIEKGPFHAIDCSIDSKRFPCPTLTLGGLVVDEASGAVLDRDRQPIPGLYAAGRNAIGICSRQYVSGLSLADCVYSGRRAGRAAAKNSP